MKSRKIDAIERGINLIYKLQGQKRRTSLNRDSYVYRNVGIKVYELACVCELWNLKRRDIEDTSKKYEVEATDLEEEHFLPDFTQKSYETAYYLDYEKSYYYELYENNLDENKKLIRPKEIQYVLDEFDKIQETIDKFRTEKALGICTRVRDYKPKNDFECEFFKSYSPNQSIQAKMDILINSKLSNITTITAELIAKNQKN